MESLELLRTWRDSKKTLNVFTPSALEGTVGEVRVKVASVDESMLVLSAVDSTQIKTIDLRGATLGITEPGTIEIRLPDAGSLSIWEE